MQQGPAGQWDILKTLQRISNFTVTTSTSKEATPASSEVSWLTVNYQITSLHFICGNRQLLQNMMHTLLYSAGSSVFHTNPGGSALQQMAPPLERETICI